jgi:GT2 family glycosyltransferase
VRSDVCVVTVAYNSSAVLPRFLSSVPRGVGTIVVDNASEDASVAIAEAAGAEVLSLEQNIGYGSASNIGARASTAKYLILANPDIRFLDGAVDQMIAAAEQYPDAAFNPRMYNGGRQAFRRWSRLQPHAGRWAGRLPGVDCSIPVLSGACIFIRREHFDLIGGFDPAIFLFHEDDDLSLRLKQAGLELRLAARAVVEHSEGGSSGRSAVVGRVKGEAMGRSLVYVMRKHDLPLNLQREALKTRSKLLLPHILLRPARRAKYLGFLRALTAWPPDSARTRP